MGIIDRKTVEDAIELFYKWEDTDFSVVIFPTIKEMMEFYNDKKLSKSMRGQYRGGGPNKIHTICLIVDNIVKGFEKKVATGGNLPAPSLKAAAMMVLTHEIQHANQTKHHPTIRDSKFWNEHSYADQACERDARSFVDERINEICAYFQLPPIREVKFATPGNPNQEVEDVAEGLRQCSEVSLTDIKDELRRSGVLNPKNTTRVRQILENSGVKIRI